METILGILSGLSVLLPGLSVIQSTRIGEVLGANNIITIFVGHILNTIKECNYSAGSDNYQLIASSGNVKSSVESIMFLKLIICGIGVLLGLLLGTILPTSTGSVILSLILGALLIYTSNNPVQAAIYIIGCGIFFSVASNITTDLISVGGICILGIPATLKALGGNNKEKETIEEINPIVFSIGSIIALFSPGINSNACFSALGSKNPLMSIVTDIFIDALGLGLLVTNIESGKSTISLVTGYADTNTIISVAVAIVIAIGIATFINPIYTSTFTEEAFLVSSLIINSLLLFLLIGFWIAPLVLFGLLIDSIGQGSTRSLVFLAPIMFL